jgi:hypothetical protein
MSWLDPPEEQEDPLIANICPVCGAVDIILNESNLVINTYKYELGHNKEEYMYNIYKC